MAVQPADLLTPAGRLERAVLWPGQSESKVLAYLTAYLADADDQPSFEDIEDETASDRARKAWAYYRAKDEQFNRMMSQPASVEDSDEGSQQYLITQLRMVEEERDKWLALFDSIIEEETGFDEDAVSYTTLRSLRD